MSLVALLVLIWALTRFGCMHRSRHWQRRYVDGSWPAQRFHQLHYGKPDRTPAQVSRFEILKRRYVSGELTDDQYECELDRLLKTPEGRRQVN